jgi:hypothetical protein
MRGGAKFTMHRGAPVSTYRTIHTHYSHTYPLHARAHHLTRFKSVARRSDEFPSSQAPRASAASTTRRPWAAGEAGKRP